MIKAVRGNTTNLRVNFVGSRPATKSLAAAATWATGLSTNLRSMPVLPIVVAQSSPSTFSIRVRKPRSTNGGRTPPATKSP
jgi:hypothetical protein